MIRVKTTSPTGQVDWVTLPLTGAEYQDARDALKALHDALGHWGGLGKSETWHATCSVQSEAQGLMLRNRDRFPERLVALVDPDGPKCGLDRMRALYALTVPKPVVRRAK